jgi:hypothetical protein
MRAVSQGTTAVTLALLALPLLVEGGRAQSAGSISAPSSVLASAVDFSALEPPAGDPECIEQGTRQRAVRSRTPGPLSWLFRFDRATEVDRHDRPFAFYLRSPLLSGLYRCPPGLTAGARPPEQVDECAELTITTDAQEERKIQLLLPQFDAKNAKRLRGHIEHELKKGRAVTVIMTGGEPFSILPDGTRDLEAKACRRDVWNEP